MNEKELNILYTKILVILQTLLGKNDPNDFPIVITIADLIDKTAIDVPSTSCIIAFLNCLGFIEVRDDKVLITSKYAAISISSLKRRFELGFPVIYKLRDDERKNYFNSFSYNMEYIRSNYHNDKTPIHFRNFINIIIKGQQIRDWIYQDVFLHEYHPDWNQYHLIGLGYRNENSSDELLKKTLKKKLGLKLEDYVIDKNINPQEIEDDLISSSNGCLTRFKINSFVVKKLNIEIQPKIESMINAPSDSPPPRFMWFTIKEINQCEFGNYKIMDSSRKVLENLDTTLIPNVAGRIKSVHQQPLLKISLDIGNRITFRNLLLFLFITIIPLVLPKIFFTLSSLFNTEIFWLTNLGSLFQILSIPLSIILFIIGLSKGVTN